MPLPSSINQLRVVSACVLPSRGRRFPHYAWLQVFRGVACVISFPCLAYPLPPIRHTPCLFRCYTSAADDGGHADASYCLGVMHYAMGDLQEAFRRYQTAAEGGNMLAWRNLASMYALGEGVPRSEQMAKSILQTFGEKIERQEREEKGEEDEPH